LAEKKLSIARLQTILTRDALFGAMADLTVDVAGLRLENPFILASGVWGETGETLARALRAGAGAVVTKSIGPEPRAGYANPTVVEVPGGLINAMGLPNPGIDAYAEEVEAALKPGKPVIGSIFGADAGEFTTLARRMEKLGVNALELNLSCPHAKGYGAQLGQDPDVTKRITAAVKAAVRIPVLVKLTPNVASIPAIGKAAEEGGADAVCAINTLKGMAIDLDLFRPVLSHGTGGYSGPGVKPVGLACVWELFEAVKIPIIGMGGISTGGDAAEYMLAGASALQVGTAVYKKRDRTFRDLCRELDRFLSARRYRSPRALIGKAHGGPA
jgi:dihydroorotate dehydrogenase (NAD+) catalytic subunit